MTNLQCKFYATPLSGIRLLVIRVSARMGGVGKDISVRMYQVLTASILSCNGIANRLLVSSTLHAPSKAIC